MTHFNMKKFFLLLIAVIGGLLPTVAQSNQVTWINGRAVMGQPVNQVDSIKYGTMNEADVLYLMLSRKMVVHDTIITDTVVVRDTIHIPTDTIMGVFSVAPNKSVCFAKGNLQYTQSTKTWSFAEHQYDMIGANNVIDGNLADKIDLFGYSGSTGVKWGISTSTNNADYSGSFVDWGTNIIGSEAPNTWRTLTLDEWHYLFQHTSWTMATVNGTLGFMLLPAGFIAPDGMAVSILSEGITSDTDFRKDFSKTAYSSNVYTVSQFSQLESIGVVFLPSAGYCLGTTVGAVGTDGNYWSATTGREDIAAGMYIIATRVDANSWYDRGCGRSVRLVHDIE